jgi:hypothetical protein
VIYLLHCKELLLRSSKLTLFEICIMIVVVLCFRCLHSENCILPMNKMKNQGNVSNHAVQKCPVL